MNTIYVALGGALGAALRYRISLIPFKGVFPVLTLITNLLGALLIGFIAGVAARRGLPAGALLFLKTGLCGGFTTFSTFSLEGFTLLQKGYPGLAVLYMVLSVGLCLLGILAGMALSRTIPAAQ